jgi:dTMP kinase
VSEQTSNKQKGAFIAFEGIDGAGKTTQIRKLSEKLSSLNIRCYETREPTDSPIGSLIHQIMTGRVLADNRVIASLFIADRVDHLLNLTDGIYHKICAGTTVVTDRYYFSSYAYHGVDINMDWVINGNSICADIVKPTLNVFLDIPVEKALERINRDKFHIELYETEERLRLVRQKYFEAFERLKDVENVIIVDANADAITVAERIWNILSMYFI